MSVTEASVRGQYLQPGNVKLLTGKHARFDNMLWHRILIHVGLACNTLDSESPLLKFCCNVVKPESS